VTSIFVKPQTFAIATLLSTLNWRLATTTGSIQMTASIMLKQLSCCEQQEKMVGLSLD